MRLNRIYPGDCLEVMAGWPADCVDLIVTSPPYNIRNGDGFRESKSSIWMRAKFHLAGFDGYSDDLPHEEYVEWQRSCLAAMWRVLRPGGAIFYNHQWRIIDGVLMDRSDILEGYPVRQVIIWDRCGGINFNPGYFLPTYQVIYLIPKGNFRLADGMWNQKDVWRIPPDQGNPHPAPMPVAVAQRCISSTTASVILDPFLGSGTTAVAAIRARRQYVGIEQSELYCQQAEERIAAERRQPALL